MSFLQIAGAARVGQQSGYYHGTIGPVDRADAVMTAIDPRPAESAHVDAGRTQEAGLRSTAVWAAASIRDATAIAAIRSYSRSAPVPHAAIHVYRVQLMPFHLGPLAIVEELRRRAATANGGGSEALVREYWHPTGTWHVLEILAPALTLLEEVPAASEREVYLLRWARYNEDLERAGSL